ncbi:MAG TPA: PDZ domain-containing protein [Actinomycetota bacterium]|nr:PDZ domain-containing protein [Actinomycetota bacterium]
MPRARRGLPRWAWLPLAVALAAAAAWVPLPLYGVGPGTAYDAESLITVRGRPEHRDGGAVLLTTVSFRRLSALDALLAWLDPAWTVVRPEALFAPGETEREEERRSEREMDRSKVDAAAVVASRVAGYPDRHRPGALVELVVPGCPAAPELAPGDVIVRIDGTRVRDERQAGRLIRTAGAGEALALEVRSGGSRRTIRLAPEPCAGSDRAVLGVVLIDNLPFGVRMAIGDVGGPSAGLAWALGLYDLLTPGDLTGGRTIAASGSVDLQGRVGAVGGIAAKVHAAAGARATVFVVPRDDAAEARSAGVAGIRIVPVRTFDEAVRFLEGMAGEGG